MKYLATCILLLATLQSNADTIDHYMSIHNAIPQMALKADPESQAWARSARNVLAITNETLAETLIEANDKAKAQGKPLFCFVKNTKLDAATLEKLIVKTYETISSRQSDKDKMTVSQIAYLGVTKAFPCQMAEQPDFMNQPQQSPMQHIERTS